ncbi:MAG: plasmid pRiA4b ORF-3 family protein [Deltaproteobacteria bacterium]|jgi:hypothetical protein|nr:plasmid pRiA4b ORF-3 family protein [Deltaproteobacteria bacterium]
MSDRAPAKTDKPPKTVAKKAPVKKDPKMAPKKTVSPKTATPAEPAGSGQSEPKAQSGLAPLYVFRIELKGITPKIWRDFYAPADTTLLEFHRLIADVMGWHGGHLFFFLIKGSQYYNPNLDNAGLGFALIEENDDDFQPLDKITLASLGLREGNKIQYVYDMGDNWEHVITVKDLNFVHDKLQQRIGCLGGARACPPEDCGSVPGYKKILKALADPNHKGFKEIIEWLDEDYDPEKFDLDELNGYLADDEGEDLADEVTT